MHIFSRLQKNLTLMKRVLEYLPVITIFAIYLGICSEDGFYKEFHVNIFALVNATDLLQLLFPKVAILTSSMYGILFSFVQDDLRKAGNNKITSNNAASWIYKNIYWIIAFYYLVLLLVLLLVKWLFSLEPYDLQYFNLVAAIIFFFLLFIAARKMYGYDFFQTKALPIVLLTIFFVGNEI